jgi:hypothetical protein
MQAHMYDRQEYLTAASAARTIYAEAGVLTFWRGLLPRMTRIIAATFILINVRSRAVAYLEEARGGVGGAGGDQPGNGGKAAVVEAGVTAGVLE